MIFLYLNLFKGRDFECHKMPQLIGNEIYVSTIGISSDLTAGGNILLTVQIVQQIVGRCKN